MHSAELQREKNLKWQSEGFQSAKVQAIATRNNILDFDALHFGIIKSSDDKVVIRIYLLASRKPHLSVY
jgi:hypothetical protein